ncbi:Scaffold-type E3 ligase [Apophysomyces sp. BC1034]|nr:Scaffold-type E3 ligase [Apophysomyces sp. BC1034]
MGYFSKDEWMHGMENLQVDSVEKLRELIPEMERTIMDETQFKNMYIFAFGYAKSAGQKSMIWEVATALWQVLLLDRYPHIKTFIEFLEEAKPVKVINKDQWSSLFDFCRSVPEDLADYDDTSSWPVLFDDYVAWRKEKANGIET